MPIARYYSCLSRPESCAHLRNLIHNFDHPVFVSFPQRFTTADGSLMLASISPRTQGEDALGGYDVIDLAYTAAVQAAPVMIARIKIYASDIVFEQHYLTALSGCSTGDADGLATVFPSFDLSQVPRDLHGPAGVAHYVSWYVLACNRNFFSPKNTLC
jgi:hypothetical protein